VGLPVVDGPLTFEEACAWEPVIRALEKQKPEWEPGTEHAYHAITFGYLVGELVRRVSGKSLGTFFHDEVAGPLGLRAWIGLPEEEEKNVQKMHFAKPFSMEEMLAGLVANLGLDVETVTAWATAAFGPGSVGARAGSLGGAFDNAMEDYFSRAYHAAEFGDSGLITDARSLARMYAATVSEVDGIRLLTPETLERAIEVQTDKTRMHGLPEGVNVPADRSFYMSLGFWRSCPPQRWAGPRSFGHPGSGGAVGFAEPDARIGFGYVTNLSSYFIGEPRAQNLADAVVACLG